MVYIGLKGEKLDGLSARYQVFDEVRYVPAGKFRRYHGESFLAHLADVKTLALNIRDFFRMIAGIFTARRTLAEIMPDVVFSKGGFVAVPVGIAARSRGIAIVTHDSDAMPGLANRIVGRWAKVHATGMPPQNYAYPKNSIHYTGVPVDERIKPVNSRLQAEYKKKLNLPPETLMLLVGGAGLGSQKINDLMIKITPSLLSVLPQLHIFHITGDRHLSKVNAGYETVLEPAQKTRLTTLGFTSDFYIYTGAADLVITRAGATTLAELAMQQKASLLIPALFLAGGHQLSNAKALGSSGAAVVVSGDVAPDVLLQKVLALLRDKSRREVLAGNLAKHAHPLASHDLARLILAQAEATGSTQ